ncbi:MAG TPA: Nif11-like leader peptide family RiPP precursor [Phototrophicaceae bacterium]|nr:Nif11-like leader peptide family RiPP precursor [Phototrophicaceae bacterium]
MSVETATAFLNKFTEKPTLRSQLYVMNPKTVDDFLRYAHSKTGYTFTKADLQAALANFDKPSAKELKQKYSL